MSLLNSSTYKSIAGYGLSSSSNRPQIFKKVFISDQQRMFQEPRKLQSIADWNAKTAEEKFVFLNKDIIHVIPIFLKQITEGYELRNKNNTLTYFNWNPTSDENRPPHARCTYIFACAAFDENMRPIPRPGDPSKPALVYFKPTGVKMNNMIQYLNGIQDRVKDLPPLSDNPDFEKSEVSFRRFMVKVSLGSADTSHGPKQVFVFDPVKEIKSETVKSILDQCASMKDEFDKQFNYTDSVVSTSVTTTYGQSQPQSVPPPFVPDRQDDMTALDDIDLGI